MKLGNLNIFFFFTLFLMNITPIFAEDEIKSVPLINLEELSPTFEEGKDELDKIDDENVNLNTSENAEDILKSTKVEKIYINLTALDKITAKTSTFKLAIGEKKFFGPLEIVVQKCQFSENNDFSEIKILPENKATEQFFVEVSIFIIKGNLEVIISIKQI